MLRISKKHSSKKAFTLTEMVLVICIILVLAAVVGFGVIGLINTANKSNDAVVASSSSLVKSIADSENMLANKNF